MKKLHGADVSGLSELKEGEKKKENQKGKCLSWEACQCLFTPQDSDNQMARKDCLPMCSQAPYPARAACLLPTAIGSAGFLSQPALLLLSALKSLNKNP